MGTRGGNPIPNEPYKLLQLRTALMRIWICSNSKNIEMEIKAQHEEVDQNLLT